ncbi:phosphonate C-P lyase system protein PhnH [Pseudoprimorskyibacter insulae]|uniref:Alpha-D-ribose 1-methylphosphonate 5-triphosphate synthase subunit PhnH n=1 Tax=Pseudoprimorskyibacter insulae TaxID=1695997 RepID=A0A2R8AN02_9RHOB|nr:phosphonate C-P lyase system protein PhnH [Pseudoprimorskyibacter insulae]SPF77428.1 Alpha-D-ribose 1-methylphosphonate 5-triphosphate synthase subunit PhnH [Pseudoprimorskyibacter insulae]
MQIAAQRGFDMPAYDSANAFRAAMSAIARPGTIQTIAPIAADLPFSQAAAVLLLTLCDHETSLFLAPDLDTPEARHWIAFHCGAPLATKADAMFALGSWDALAPLDDYAQGTPEYPDRSATLIVEMPEITQAGPRLTGPGIQTEAYLALPDTASLMANHAKFPRGVDLFLTSGCQIAALPRSTKIEVR